MEWWRNEIVGLENGIRLRPSQLTLIRPRELGFQFWNNFPIAFILK